MPQYLIRVGDLTYVVGCEQLLTGAIPDEVLIKGCLKGLCRVCRCHLIAGHVIENGREVAVGSEFLPCISRAATDLEIMPAVSDFYSATVLRKAYLSQQVVEIVLGVKRNFFNSKTIVTLRHPDSSIVRSYSLVTLKNKNYDQLTIHVKLREGGVFRRFLSRYLLVKNWITLSRPR